MQTLRVRIEESHRPETLLLKQILILAALVSVASSGPIAAQLATPAP
jgi:hypothetical protein